MKYETEIRLILLNILATGLLRIRASGGNGDAGNCWVEADRLHNLPGLVREPKLDLLKYYWNIERPSFVRQTKSPSGFEADWDELGAILVKLQKKSVLNSILK
jgi:hypothetical protein